MGLRRRLDERTARIAVVGLGYAGLPLSVRAAAAGFSVLGVDIDPAKIDLISSGTSPISGVSSEDVAAQVASGRLKASLQFPTEAELDAVVICVPTPLKDELPDVSFIESAANDVSRILRRGMLVILESTSYPGTTEEVVRSALEVSGLSAGEDFHLGFSPERLDPSDPMTLLASMPKVVGGIDAVSSEMMAAFYSAIADQVVTVSSPRVAEMAKLLENTYRHVNIALINEIAVLCHELGIDVWEVIDAAATKPFGFQAFYPGPGWGGHCIPVDPAYLSWRVRQMGETARFVELALEINRGMPGYVVGRIEECLREAGRALKGATVLVLGVTYKPGVPDTRNSPSIEVLRLLAESGASVEFNDPLVDHIEVGGTRLASIELTERALVDADLVAVLTDHPTYDWGWVAKHARLVFDTRNALKGTGGKVVRL